VRPADAVRRALRTSAARQPELFAPGTRLVVGFSGGQDSTCLLHALRALRPDLDLRAVHVDHALRATSAEAAAAAGASAAALDVALETVRVDVPAYRAAQPGCSIEQAARAARYHVLAARAAACQASAVLVAHTADDRAETLLLHLLRGAGLAGLGALRVDQTLPLAELGPAPREVGTAGPSSVRVVRPLLGVARATTGAYCTVLGLPVVSDPSNASGDHLRNRVRQDLLPVLATYNPAIGRVLARTAELLAEDAVALEALLDEPYRRLTTERSATRLAFDRAGWLAEPRAVQRRLLRRALAELTGTLADVRAAPVEDALDLVRSGRGPATYDLPAGIELSIGSRSVVLCVRDSAVTEGRKVRVAQIRAYNASTPGGSPHAWTPSG
jgi:tRNA(Ile)-lysidine synthetase-like protein